MSTPSSGAGWARQSITATYSEGRVTLTGLSDSVTIHFP